ncbi:MAG: hypothetical protein N2259_00560 [Patescibacteria group bacterium]|nr:hypothetical protein [Patescibacteria group bacterium]
MRQIKLKFIVSKWTNFFFLIDNFAGYRKTVFHEYNKENIKQFGHLTKKEKEALKKYKKIAKEIKKKRHPNALRECFLKPINQPSKIWRLIYQRFTKLQLEQLTDNLKNIFEIFQPRFEKFWGKYYYSLEENYKILKKSYPLIKKHLSSLLNKLSVFYGANCTIKNMVIIYLIIMPSEIYWQGGVTVGENKIILVLGSLDRGGKNINSIWKLILHELSHLFFETIEYKNLINKFSLYKKLKLLSRLRSIKRERWQELSNFLKEIINSSSIWNLCKFKNPPLSSDHKNYLEIISAKLNKLNLQKKKNIVFDLNTIKQYVAWRSERLFKQYILKNKKIDRKYLKTIYSILSHYPANLFRDLGIKNGLV